NGGTTATAAVTAANNDITCTFTDAHLVLVKVAKSIVGTPPDGGKFNLLIDGSVVKADAGNGDLGQKLSVAAGTPPFSETAGTATSLDNYTSTVSCITAGGTKLGSANGTSLTLNNLPGGTGGATGLADVLCTLVNTVKAGKITFVKVTTPT